MPDVKFGALGIHFPPGANWLNLVNYTTLLGSGDFGDALKHQSLLAETTGHLRRMNGQEVPVAAAVSR